MGQYLDLKGHRFGRLVAIKISFVKKRQTYWLCQCDCGTTVSIRLGRLRSGGTLSCGCYRLDQLKKALTIHGESDSREYIIWNGMMQRCYKPNYSGYIYYGQRGIKVCDRWHTYLNFLHDMGRVPPDKGSLDRIDNDKDYSHENCRWATSQEQANNKRTNVFISMLGKTQTIKQWCDELELKYKTVSARLRRGVDPSLAFKMKNYE